MAYSQLGIDSYAKIQYDTLVEVLPGKVSLGSDPDYQKTRIPYFSQQAEEISPSCIVTPQNTDDVSIAVKALASVYESSSHSAQFAIRGRGHTPWAGSASLEGGAVIEMTSIGTMTVNADESVISVGAGAKWADVYAYLGPKNLTVCGGRAATVGVGGLTLGGGLSYFSARKGFVCDNVVNFEIVLANGTIANANKYENTDLWTALRGGSNNFGVVTRFDIETFDQGPFWGGIVHYPIATASHQLSAFYNFTQDPEYDEYSAIIVRFGYRQGHGVAAINGLYYTKPQANPPKLQPFTAIKPQLASTVRIGSLLEVMLDRGAASPDGWRLVFPFFPSLIPVLSEIIHRAPKLPNQRQIYITTTFKNDLSFLNTVYERFSSTINQIENLREITWSLTFQPIVPAIASKSIAQGGNSQGLNSSDGPLVNVLLGSSWTEAADDELVNEVAAKFITDVETLAREKGVYHRFVYLNYADKTQNPMDGYGEANKKKLQAVSRKYDPQGLFQKGVPGGFKLFTK